MSVDTRNKRFSLVSLGLWKGRVLPNPDGGFTTSAERGHLELLYALGATAPVTSSPGVLRVLGLYAPTLTATGQYQPTLSFIGRFEG